MFEALIEQLAASEPLTEGQIGWVVEQLVNDTVPVPMKAALLSGLAQKGETPAEIAEFARQLRARALQPEISDELRRGEILDVVGTGGDRLSTFNISTTVALIASAAGILVAKHGNRASTSPIGSADVMEALGIPFDLGPEEAVRFLNSMGSPSSLPRSTIRPSGISPRPGSCAPSKGRAPSSISSVRC